MQEQSNTQHNASNDNQTRIAMKLNLHITFNQHGGNYSFFSCMMQIQYTCYLRMPCIDQQAAESLALTAIALEWTINELCKSQRTNRARAMLSWQMSTAGALNRSANRRNDGTYYNEQKTDSRCSSCSSPDTRANFFSMAVIAHARATFGRHPLKNVDPKAGGARTVDPKAGARHIDFPYLI